MVRPLFLAALLSSACSPRERGPASLPPGDYRPRGGSGGAGRPPQLDSEREFSSRERDDERPLLSDRAAEVRNDAFARARVWREPAIPVPEADFRANPPGTDSFAPEAELVCRFLLRRSGGRTPKFHCVLPTGEVIKVKYGRRNPEPFAEVAATRLLSALGFGADRMYRVARVRCFGCPPYPHSHFAWLDSFFTREGEYVDIAPASIERPYPGRRIASP